jgi:hypothetical protein
MYVRTIDIAHPPLTSEAAEELLDHEMSQIRYTRAWRVLKVIHGYGSGGGRSVLKDVVRNWSYRNREHLLAVIPGEQYDIFDTKTIEMRKACGQVSDPDLGARNLGITLMWII